MPNNIQPLPQYRSKPKNQSAESLANKYAKEAASQKRNYKDLSNKTIIKINVNTAVAQKKRLQKEKRWIR